MKKPLPPTPPQRPRNIKLTTHKTGSVKLSLHGVDQHGTPVTDVVMVDQATADRLGALPVRPSEARLGLRYGDKSPDPCTVCKATPTVYPTGLCGPCCFGEADTINGNW